MSGPPRTPTQIRRAKGNPGKRAYNKREPKLPVGTPEAPHDLSAAELAEWKRLIAVTRRSEVLTIAERSILELACRAYASWIEAHKTVADEGQTYETETVTGARVIKAHPAVAIAADAWRRYRAAIVELGLTPAARAKVSTVDPIEEEDVAEGYFN